MFSGESKGNTEKKKVNIILFFVDDMMPIPCVLLHFVRKSTV